MPFSDSATDPIGHLRSLLSALPIPVVVHDLDEAAAGHFVNPAFTACFGYTLEDIPDLGAWAVRAYPDPVYRDQVISDWRAQIMARRTTGTIMPPAEYRVIDNAGHPHDVLIGFTLQGTVAIVTLQDVTPVRAAETALAAEKRKNELTAFALTENMPAGAYTMILAPGDSIAQFAFVSKKFLEILELTHEEAVGDPTTGFSRVHPEDRPRWLEINAEAFARRAPFSGETRIVANGETRWIRAESVPRALEDGSVIWEGILVDINELKETEQQLMAVLDASRGYRWKLDLRRRVAAIGTNRGKDRRHSPGDAELTLDDWLAAVHPDDRDQMLGTLEALESGAASRLLVTYRRMTGDGQWSTLQVHAGVTERDLDGRPRVVSGVKFDITSEIAERNRAQEEQAQLREDLQRAQQRDTVAQVAGGVAHDVNNLIAVIAGTVEVMEPECRSLPRLRDGLHRIRRSVDMARDLITGLGGLVRPDQPRAVHDLRKVLEDTIGLLGSRRVARHGVRLIAPKAEVPIWANPTEIAQVIMNLALNACDSGATGGTATVTLTAHRTGTATPQRPPDAGVPPPLGLPLGLFSISDTGAGITDEIRARMFRPNFTTKGRAGTGLGLLIVSTILQGNRAALWVDSTPGAGTTITVAWPALETAGPASAASAPTGGVSAAPALPASADMLEGVHALVVDDVADVAEVLADMLEGCGAIACAESDPMEARKSLSEAPEIWSVLVTDLHMPGLDGRALARIARAQVPPVPVVLVTARPDTLDAAQSAEFAAVLSKPVSAAQLAHAVRTAADRRHTRPVPAR